MKLASILDLIYPRLCVICERALLDDEQHLCMLCEFNLPKVNTYSTRKNETYLLLRAEAPIEYAWSALYFKKGSGVQEILHRIKYKSDKRLARYLAAMMAEDLKLFCEREGVDFDAIIPVPIHKKKRRKRGYNQTEILAEGMADVLELPIEKGLLGMRRKKFSQTKKGRFERWLNTEQIFYLKEGKDYNGKHVLLLDDVLTTGSTLLRCLEQLFKVEGLKVSVYTLALADRL